MTVIRARSANRPGYTLIELMVVVTIIAILVSLLLVGVMKALSKGPEIQTRVEIGEMDIGVQNVISTYKIKFMPSQLKLSEAGSYPNQNTQGTPDYNSVNFLKRMFPRLNCGTATTAGSKIDWNRNGTIDADVTLQGPECLVFFLGGPGNLGFSADPSNPANTVSLQPVAFEFKPKRLQASQVASGYFVYLDAYATPQNAQPYAYFTSYYQGNDYSTTDCASYGIAPYVDPNTNRFINPNGYQIISAGANWNFGTGGTIWNPVTGTNDIATKDNQANFATGLLVAPQ